MFPLQGALQTQRQEDQRNLANIIQPKITIATATTTTTDPTQVSRECDKPKHTCRHTLLQYNHIICYAFSGRPECTLVILTSMLDHQHMLMYLLCISMQSQKHPTNYHLNFIRLVFNVVFVDMCYAVVCYVLCVMGPPCPSTR